ncbi:PQQ-dependent sugar dehydrogenase [Saccharomonospora saliphila]|uniref:PQQ-dependent sugar dehydrogenase n=1 Tax=Saccharomonospora saliphila TaxID=369829 RepID=UPI00039D8CE8|nr:PQQ-dependent sugar dehydrogenase [Saccharomonospora saliphila]
MSRAGKRVLVLGAASLLTALLVPQASARTDEPIADPLPDATVSGLGLEVEKVVTLPESEPEQPPTDDRLRRHARINYMGEVPDGSGRYYVPDLNGSMYLIDDGKTHTYLDIAERFAPEFYAYSGLGSGAGFIAFHPDFAENGKVYTVHTEARDALENEEPDLPNRHETVIQGVITEWTADDPSANTFSGTSREMLRVSFPTRIHGFQQIGFNPTARPGDEDYGLLYVAAGDGGAGVYSDVPQDLSVPQGKLLRIDPEGTNGASGEYGIPRSNPFVGKPGALGEIYAVGFRDPHRFSWDRATGKLYLGSIGQHQIESIYEVRKGDNMGWSEREGPFVYKWDSEGCAVYPLPKNDRRYGYTYPVAAYDHDAPEGYCSDVGRAVIGGFVYRGDDVPMLRGKYLFGDGVDGRLFYSDVWEMRHNAKDHTDLATLYTMRIYDDSGEVLTMRDLAGDERVDLRFGTDAEGELFILSKANGTVWKVTGAQWQRP